MRINKLMYFAPQKCYEASFADYDIADETNPGAKIITAELRHYSTLNINPV